MPVSYNITSFKDTSTCDIVCYHMGENTKTVTIVSEYNTYTITVVLHIQDRDLANDQCYESRHQTR